MGVKEGTLYSLALGDHSIRVSSLARSVLHHMLQALDFLATKGIIHRDLKPENILYVSQGDQYHFQLGDFGLSNRHGVAVTFAGTQVYMAPEIPLGKAQTSKADVWSLFVTILWTLDVGGIRQLETSCGTYEDVKAAVLSAATLAVVRGIKEMARADPTMRASAAQMLVKIFSGNGLSTPRAQVSPISASVDETPVVNPKMGKIPPVRIARARTPGQGAKERPRDPIRSSTRLRTSERDRHRVLKPKPKATKTRIIVRRSDPAPEKTLKQVADLDVGASPLFDVPGAFPSGSS